MGGIPAIRKPNPGSAGLYTDFTPESAARGAYLARL